MFFNARTALCALALVLSGCGTGAKTVDEKPPAAPGAVDAKRLTAADSEPGQWMSHGRTYDEQRFSPLDQIKTDNVKNLGLAWFADLDTHRGQEATPIVVDGVMYISTAWSKVKAYDAATGAKKWEYDPQVPGSAGVKACCDVVNRGVAVWEGKVFVGTLDGRLVAIDAATGQKAWEVLTVDQSQPYTITGAPRVVKGHVLIGNGGGEFGVRGYISAYDAKTGKMDWRFYTVPGDPKAPPDGAASDDAMKKFAASTWFGEWWKLGGGGTVWDSMAYDPQLDLLYVGVGNGSPWNHSIRSQGKGDNLFLASIVALKPDDGSYVWHYQSTPAEADRPCRSRDQRREAPRRDAGAEERLLLCAGRQDRRVHFREQLHASELGQEHRREGPPRGKSGSPLQPDKQTLQVAAESQWRAHMAFHVVQPGDWAGLYSDPLDQLCLWERHQFQTQKDGDKPGRRIQRKRSGQRQSGRRSHGQHSRPAHCLEPGHSKGSVAGGSRRPG
jgi:hypothetical protein